jgi:hypothetical protein
LEYQLVHIFCYKKYVDNSITKTTAYMKPYYP